MIDEKMIEEMAKVIINASRKGSECENCHYVSTVEEAKTCCICLKALYNAGYRKLPEDAVVLTREEHKQWLKDLRRELRRELQQAQKETVKDFAKRVKERIKFLKTLFYATGEGEYNGIEPDEIDELAKQYGVEVEE